MNITRKFRITGTGKYLPPQVLKAEDLEKRLKLPSGWSEKFSGVREKHHAVDESNAEMAASAINMALDRANLKFSEIDMLISCSATFDYILPFQAALILRTLNGKVEHNIPAMDINSSCLSFISAMDVATSLLDGKRLKRIAIVSSEVSSVGANIDNKETYTLFGDGAAAAIIEWSPDYDGGMEKYMMKTYPEGFFYSIIKGGGNAVYPRNNPYDPWLYSFNMEGKKLLRLAKIKIPLFFEEFYAGTGERMDAADVIIPHQASKMGMALFQGLFPDVKDKIYSNLDTHGNCIAASVPMGLHDTIEKGLLKRGDSCLLAGTAAGFAIGAFLFKY